MSRLVFWRALMLFVAFMPTGAWAEAGDTTRVPLLQGMHGIYELACQHLVDVGEEANLTQCIKDAVASVMDHDGKDAYKTCEEQGGMLSDRMRACAHATFNIAALGDSCTPERLLQTLGDAHSLCTPAVLCEGEEPVSMVSAQDGNGNLRQP